MAKLISVERTGFRYAGRSRWVGYNQFRAVFEGEPGAGDIGAAQVQAGYDPRGYGGAWNVATTPNGDGTYTTTFEVSNNSD